MTAVVRVSPEQVRVEPGGVVELTVAVTNKTLVVEQYRFDALGLPGGAYFEPATVNLLPGAEGRVTGHLTVSIDAPFGGTTVGVRAVGDATGAVGVAETHVTVGQKPAIEAFLKPVTATGHRKGRHSLFLANNGNVPTAVELTAVAETDGVAVDLPATANVDRGESREIGIVSRVTRRPEKGEKALFTVTVAHDGRLIALPGALQTVPRSIRPRLLGAAAAILLAVLVLVLLLWGGGDDDLQDLSVDTSTTGASLVFEPPPTIPFTSSPSFVAPPAPTIVTFPPPAISSFPTTTPTTQRTTTTRAATTTVPASTTSTIPETPRQFAQRVYNLWLTNGDTSPFTSDEAEAVLDSAGPSRQTGQSAQPPSACDPAASNCGEVGFSPPCTSSPRGVVRFRVTGVHPSMEITKVVLCDPPPAP